MARSREPKMTASVGENDRRKQSQSDQGAVQGRGPYPRQLGVGTVRSRFCRTADADQMDSRVWEITAEVVTAADNTRRKRSATSRCKALWATMAREPGRVTDPEHEDGQWASVLAGVVLGNPIPHYLGRIPSDDAVCGSSC